ncbi:ataxin 1 [Echinococcus multilocularis]|uniref:Ataxin 1 n=1 Tax=Echinococcus multilocularis TaxID=6211 RepID=A0A068Y8I4_ECHMU|nr:ataxin 1 [Echinococcus multilocularis]
MEAFKKLRESDFLVFYELLRQSMRNLCSTGGRVCGKNNCHSPYVITFDHVCNRKQPFFVRSHGWSSCDPYLTQTRCGLPCRPLLVGDFCLVIIPSEISRPLSPTLQVNSTSSSCIGKAPPLSEGL